jgi:hypothetical protein
LAGDDIAAVRADPGAAAHALLATDDLIWRPEAADYVVLVHTSNRRASIPNSTNTLAASLRSNMHGPRVRNSALGRTLSIMEKDTNKVLGDVLRQQLPTEESRLPKEMRRLIVQLERRQRELDQQRDHPPKREPH